jgi:hypothetical protein
MFHRPVGEVTVNVFVRVLKSSLHVSASVAVGTVDAEPHCKPASVELVVVSSRGSCRTQYSIRCSYYRRDL